MSIFVGKSGLRTQYVEAVAADLNTATSASNAFCFARVEQPCRIGLLANSTSADIVILVCHPDNDPSVEDNRFEFIELPANTPLNLDTSFGMNLSVDPGTWFFAFVSRGTVNATEKLRAFFWG